MEVDITGQGCEPFIGELLNSRWQVDRDGNVLKTMVQKALEAFDCSRYLCHFAPQWMDYGQEFGLTDTVTTEPEATIDPDVALQRARWAEADRIWKEEYQEEGASDDIGVIAW
jgi:phage/plasmid primase-like uncharacterized protein